MAYSLKEHIMNQRPQRKPPMGPPGPSNYYPRYYPRYRYPCYDHDYYWDRDYDYDWGDYYRDEVIADNTPSILSAYKQGLVEGRAQALEATGTMPPGYNGSMGATGYCGSTGA